MGINTLEQVEERYCFNCGSYDHLHRSCIHPITSYGMIVYHIALDGTIKYLLIQRNFSPEYRGIIHNLRYYFDQRDAIAHMIEHLTQLELRYLQHYPFEELYHQLTQFYPLKNTPKYQKNVDFHSKTFKKFIHGTKNRAGEYLKLETLLAKKTLHKWSQVPRPLEPDWGFPKGRRNKRSYESNIDCAKREVFEETEIGPHHYHIPDPNMTFREIFQGTDGITYQHIYYLAKTPEYQPVFINPFNKHQLSEVRKVGWFSYSEATALFRDYHVEKKELLKQVHQFLTNNVVSEK